MIPDGMFRPGLELMTYLDGNLSSNGLDDPALGISFLLPWWTNQRPPTESSPYLSSASLQSALNHYRRQLQAALIPFGVPHTIRNLADELNKPAYTWHSSVNDDLPNYPNHCTRCRLYRAVAVGVMDQLRDTYNMVHACEIANEAEKDIAIRRASGFNELYEAALNKECSHAVGSASGPGSGGADNQESGSGKGKEKQRFGPEVEKLKTLTKKLVMEGGGMASSKWTWGVDLTDDDLRGLIRGADRQDEGPHSGYDRDHPTGSLMSQTSHGLDLANLEDPNDPDLLFDELTQPITIIPELRSHDFPSYAAVQLDASGDCLVESEPDSAIKAFTKRAKAQATKANKLLLQEEVDQPVSFFDDGSEFILRTTLIPRRPWLAPRLPIILPPNNVPPVHNAPTDHVMGTDSDPNDEFPDHIIIPDSDEHLIIPDSDSSPSSPILLPDSGDEANDAMDVVKSDDQKLPTSDVNTDSESGSASDDIVFPESPMATTVDLGAMAIEHDPGTGHCTPASFANFPDEFLD
jgi:hypothetical protein